MIDKRNMKGGQLGAHMIQSQGDIYGSESNKLYSLRNLHVTMPKVDNFDINSNIQESVVRCLVFPD